MHDSEPTVHDLFRLDGQVALLTGAAGFLGSRMAQALAEAGATVIATSRDAGRAQDAADALPTNSGQTHFGVSLNYLSSDSIIQAFQQSLQLAGQVDILVNNGHDATSQDWQQVTHDQFTRQLANASGYFMLARELRDHLVRRGAAGTVVMLGSMYGLVGSYPDAYAGVSPASPVAYHALKGGIAQMTRHLAAYWAADRIRVNCLCPGPFPDPDRAPRPLIDRLIPRVPLGRMGRPEELKGAIVFLTSNASSYMTGQLLVVDGGWTAW